MAARPLQFIASRHHHYRCFSLLAQLAALFRRIAFQFTSISQIQRQQQEKPSPPLPPPQNQKQQLYSIIRRSGVKQQLFSISRRSGVSVPETMAQKIGKSIRRPGAPSKARVYPDVNVIRPKEYWDY